MRKKHNPVHSSAARSSIDVESMFRLRHGNMIRVWGYLVGPVFKILWYDHHHHKVCPSES